MNKLFVLCLVFMLSGCFAIKERGWLTDKSIPHYGGTYNNGEYVIDFKKYKLDIGYEIGECGGGVEFLLFFPMWFGENSCKESFYLTIIKIINRHIKSLNFTDIAIKYNNTMHYPIDKHIIRGFIFKNINTDELKKANDTAIIIKDPDGTIHEIPFKWGWDIFG